MDIRIPRVVIFGAKTVEKLEVYVGLPASIREVGEKRHQYPCSAVRRARK